MWIAKGLTHIRKIVKSSHNYEFKLIIIPTFLSSFRKRFLHHHVTEEMHFQEHLKLFFCIIFIAWI
jgi:hypothetical protein